MELYTTVNKFEEGLLTYLSETQLLKIRSVKIGIGGAGGLGSNAAMILVRSGFNNLEILDHDIIEPSNLNRQQFYLSELGQSKVVCLKKHLLEINPDCKIEIYQEKWAVESAAKYFNNCNYVVEAFDKADWKFKFVDYYQEKAKYIISGNGMAGLTQKQPMKIRKVGNIYIVGDNTTDTTDGHPPMAPRVTACAAHMAEVVLDLTLGITPSLSST